MYFSHGPRPVNPVNRPDLLRYYVLPWHHPSKLAVGTSTWRLIMRTLAALMLTSSFFLEGCGSNDSIVKEVKDTVTAPVDNIKKNVDTLEDTRSSLKNMAKKRSDDANAVIDERLKSNN